MTVEVQFQLDTNRAIEVATVTWPHDTREQAKDKLEKVINNGDALLPVRDAETGDFVFVNTMKLSEIVIKEK